MPCRFAERVSALVDGELAPADAAELERHLPHCASCRAARQDFSLLGQRMASSFDCAPPHAAARREALAKVLHAAATRPPDDPSPRAASLAGLWRAPVLGGALAALLLLCSIAALAFYLTAPRPESQLAAGVAAPPDPAPIEASLPSDTSPGTSAERTDEGVEGETSAPSQVVAGGAPSNESRRKISSRRRPPSQAGAFSPTAFRESEFSGTGLDSPARAPLSAGRHVEQVMLLLRSLRNARPTSAASGFDLAYEKRQSRKLISQNVVLRREAARTGDVVAESLLEDIEPILIDIAHLPEKSATGEVRTIKDRLRRQHVFAMLRAGQIAHAQGF